MQKIKLAVTRKSVQQKIADGEAIAPQLIADADAEVQAAGAALATETTALKTKNTERTQKEDDAKAATVGLRTQAILYDDALRAASGKMMEKYKGNIEKWKEAGFQVGGEFAHVGKPSKVENLSVTLGDVSGDADLQWDPIAKVKCYKIQFAEIEGYPANAAAESLKEQANWKPFTPNISTKSKVAATGLTPGKFILFRVAAFNAAGTGAWSNPVGRIIS